VKASSLAVAVLCCAAALAAEAGEPPQDFVRVSPRDRRYLELSDGTPYIPIGLNAIAPRGGNLSSMEDWFRNLSANRGNFVRIWLSNPYFDIEHARSGEYDGQKARRIDELLALARRHGIRLKLCLEHFRALESGQSWATKPIHHVSNGGPARTMAEFFESPTSREQFKRKLACYANRYGDDPIVFGWELWNEVNAVQGNVNVLDWSAVMLAELHRLFPRNLALQNLGSFDTPRVNELYRAHSLLAGNDLAQVHRYLDLGARIEACRGPVDLLAIDAVRTIQSYDPAKPILLAESGAVEPGHTGPFKLYEKDKEGIILHDVLFAPFFAGACGPGHIWHWDVYVARNTLWHHFDRFAQVVDRLDPPAEAFQSVQIPHQRLRVLALRGKNTTLLWCRDMQNNWMTELRDGQAPATIQDMPIQLPDGWEASAAKARFFNPWTNRWTEGPVAAGRITPPPFSRSMVVRIDR